MFKLARCLPAVGLVALLINFFGGLAKADVTNSNQLLSSISLNVEKYKLPNGLTVLLLEDHSAPFFTLHLWFDVGSKHEKPGLSGLAHFFEHYMFKGTSRYPFPSYERLVAANGGNFNAFTSRDYTGYYVNMPSEKLDLALDLESDRMRNLVFDEKKIQSEREVVKEERRMRYEDDISGVLYERLFLTLFKVHPYRWPVIGSMADLNRATQKDLEDFYRIYYAPNNATLVLVGDFSTSTAKTLIKKYFSQIPSQPLPNYTPVSEPLPVADRQAKIKKSVQNASVMVGFPIVKAGHPDMYALDIASSLLGSGNSSRLHRKLVYDLQLATRVSVSSMTMKDLGAFNISISLKPGASAEKVLQVVYSELKKLREKSVSDKELEKAKNWIMRDHVNGLKTISGKAYSLAVNEIYYGDYREIFKDLERYMKVSKEQIQEVANTYIVPGRRSVIRLEPTLGQSSGEQGADSE